MEPSDLQLFEAQSRVQVGCYLHDVVMRDNFSFAYSDVTDYWFNHAFGLRLDDRDPRDVFAEIKEVARSVGRTPYLAVGPSHDVNALAEIAGTTPFAGDAWMTRELTALEPSKTDEIVFVDVETSSELDEFVSVFADGYGPIPKDHRSPVIGYHDLSPVYNDIIRSAQVPEGVKRHRWIARVNDESAAVVSTYSSNKLCGIYDVTVAYRFRSQGIGTAICKHALYEALAQGDDFAFLLTEHDSPLEAWYESMGFKTSFVSQFIPLN